MTKVRNPGDVITIIPYLLGFEPAESLVVVALEGPRQRIGPCARLDLVDGLGIAEYVAALVRRHGFDPVILVAFTEREQVADAVVPAVLERLAAGGVDVVQAVRADGTRWWSYACSDPRCCPPGGTPYDPESSRVAAEAVLAGLSRAPTRDALRSLFEARRDLRAAFDDQLARSAPPLPLEAAAVVALVRQSLDDPEALTPRQQVELVVAVQEFDGRDVAWGLMTREDAAEHFALWVRLLQAVPDLLLPPVGSLAAFAAWLTGRGVLASHGAERVLRVDPDYSMAQLLLDLCASSVPPSAWSQVTSRLSSERAG